MATDGERRAAARSLRDIAAHSEWVHAESIQKALGLETHPLLIDGSLYTSASVSRLADLIEPTDGFDLDTVARVCFECLEGCDEPEYTLYDTIHEQNQDHQTEGAQTTAAQTVLCEKRFPL